MSYRKPRKAERFLWLVAVSTLAVCVYVYHDRFLAQPRHAGHAPGKTFLENLAESESGDQLPTTEHFRGRTSSTASTSAVDSMGSCQDKTKLMPACTECIPGLSGLRCEMDAPIVKLRQDIKDMAYKRYRSSGYDLYPYLNSGELRARQASVAQWLAHDGRKAILDIGTNYSPLFPHFPKGFCPELLVMVEPIGELPKRSLPDVPGESHMYPWMSQVVECPAGGGRTHIIIAPTSITEYLSTSHARSTTFDAVVCMGCDTEHGRAAFVQ